MPHSSRAPDSRLHVPARRRRSFARMSDQEMRAVFDAVEPKFWLIKRRRWAEAIIALVIAACLFGLFASKVSSRTDRTSDVQARTSIDVSSVEHTQESAGQQPGGKIQAGKAGTNAAADDRGSSGSRGKPGNYESPLAF